MSLLIDDRESADIPRHLACYGLPVSICRLDYADCVIEAKSGQLIGIERKRLPDLIASMQDRRLSGRQLRGMFQTYDRCELIIEGLWRPSSAGAIEQFERGSFQPIYRQGSGVSYRQVESYLYSLAECGGVKVSRTGGPMETAALYASRWHWWQKDYELHRSHDQIYACDPAASQQGGRANMHIGEPNLVTLVAAQLPGIDSKAWDIGRQFPSVYAMAAAGVNDWTKITWNDRKGNVKRFGKGVAKEIVRVLRGELRGEKVDNGNA